MITIKPKTREDVVMLSGTSIDLHVPSGTLQVEVTQDTIMINDKLGRVIFDAELNDGKWDQITPRVDDPDTSIVVIEAKGVSQEGLRNHMLRLVNLLLNAGEIGEVKVRG